MTMNQDISQIVQELLQKGIISDTNPEITKTKGTTDGVVYILQETGGQKLVVKIDYPQEILQTVQFLHTYQQSPLLPTLLYGDPRNQFMVYSYLEGTTHYNRGAKLKWMILLIDNLLNHYEKCEETENWGRHDLPRKTWHEFNMISIEQAQETLAPILPVEDHFRVKALVDELSVYESYTQKYRLHGDTGVHNFVFHDSQLKGVIDPSPMVGPIVYDFTYAFCSSPDDLNAETLIASFSNLKIAMDELHLRKEVVVQLYTRLGICARVHPQDLEDYLKAWEYWKLKI